MASQIQHSAINLGHTHWGSRGLKSSACLQRANIHHSTLHSSYYWVSNLRLRSTLILHKGWCKHEATQRLEPTLRKQEWQYRGVSASEVNGVSLGILTHFRKEEIQSMCSSFPEFTHETVAHQTAEIFCLSWMICTRNPLETEGAPV